MHQFKKSKNTVLSSGQAVVSNCSFSRKIKMDNEVIIQSPKASSILYYNSLCSNGENDIA